MLLCALAKLKTNFQCVILGDGNHRRACEQLCSRLGLEDRVQFCGYVMPSNLHGFYLEASVFVMSSLWPEPFGMAGPEAMRYGLPVVAFDAGGIHEWLHDGQNGFLVSWGDTDAFARRIEALLGNKELARQMGRRGLEMVQHYDAAKQINKLEDLFQCVIRQTRRSVDPFYEPVFESRPFDGQAGLQPPNSLTRQRLAKLGLEVTKGPICL